ncbi:unnamed protein product [Cochlearia groenlandica]
MDQWTKFGPKLRDKASTMMERNRSGIGGETMNNSGLGRGDGEVETMDGRGTSQGGYGATALMDRRDAWKQLCL